MYNHLLTVFGVGLSVGVLSAVVHEMTGLPLGWSAAALLGFIAYHEHYEHKKLKAEWSQMAEEALALAKLKSLKK